MKKKLLTGLLIMSLCFALLALYTGCENSFFPELLKTKQEQEPEPEPEPGPGTLYSVTMENDGNGIAMATPSVAEEGENVTISAMPKYGYAFREWRTESEGVELDGVAANPAAFSMPGNDVKIKAFFVQMQFGVIVRDNEKTYNGNAQYATVEYAGGVTVAEAGELTVTYVDVIGAAVEPVEAGVYGIEISTTGGTKFQAVSGINVGVLTIYGGDDPGEGQNETAYSVTMEDDGNGMAVADPAEAKKGTNVTVRAMPTVGYRFEQWVSVSGGVPISGVTANPAVFTMPDNDVTIKALFSTMQFNVVVTENEKIYNGSPQYARVEYGSGITFELAGVLTVTYVDTQGEVVEHPTYAGSYGIIISTTGGTAYSAVSGANVGTLTIANASELALTGIAVTSYPVKTTYTVGERLNLNGLVVTASYSNGTTQPVSGFTAFPANGDILNNTGQRTVGISYTENGVTRTAYFLIYVNVQQTYTVTFAMNDGTSAAYAQRNVAMPAVNIDAMPPAPERMGYVFGGWYTEADGSGMAFYQGTPVTSSFVVYAKWTPITYTVMYNINKEGSKFPERITDSLTDSSGHTYGAAKPLNKNTYIYDSSYVVFAGWSTLPGKQSVVYTDEQQVLNLRDTAGSITLYAQWRGNEYTVVFHKGNFNGTNTAVEDVQGTMTVQVFEIGQAQNLTANAYSHEHFEWLKWTTNASGSGTSYTDEQSVNLNVTAGTVVNLYAQWSHGYYVVYHNSRKVGNETALADGFQGSMPSERQTFKKDVAQNLTANGYSHEYFNFRVWNTNADGTGTSYIDSQSVTNLTTTAGATVNLYAHWNWKYNVGSDGPGGGKIFYRSTPAGFTVQMANPADNYLACFLEVSSAYFAPIPWGESDYTQYEMVQGVSSGGNNIIGDGRRNTQLIVEHMRGKNITGTAAQACYAATFGSKNDWWLPSMGELLALVREKYRVNLQEETNILWSSSQYSAGIAYYLDFTKIYVEYDFNNGEKNKLHRVRPIRAF